MASLGEVKKYLAHWFQLGKGVISDTDDAVYLPKSIIQGDCYSDEFEHCWQTLMKADPSTLHLRGTEQSLADLLLPSWEIVSCARCDMPIPITYKQLPSTPCTCDDLPNWPDETLPRPRLPVNSHDHLAKLRSRLEEQR
ncbi:MAG: hypothetical protein WA947_03730 [Phormidesmis sp.]